MITGKSGHKQVAHIEMLYSSGRISNVTLKRRGVSILNSAKGSIVSSYNIGLKDHNLAVEGVHKAKTFGEKEKARLELVDAKLKELEARRKKADALLRQIKNLK